MKQNKVSNIQRQTVGKHWFALLKWIAMGLVTGSVLGLVGTAFAYSLEYVNELRQEHGWLLYCLPLAGVAIVALYHFAGNQADKGTNTVIDSIQSPTKVTYKTAPLIFVSTVLTHLCGGSAGREGAALQLGGSINSTLADIPFFRFSENDKKVNIMSGMSAGFAALFRTPLAAAVFSLEVGKVGVMQYSALVPCMIAAFTADRISGFLGVPLEIFPVLTVPEYTLFRILQCLLYGAVLGVVSILFCEGIHKVDHLYNKYLPNPYVRIVAAGCIVIAMAKLLRTNIYLGSGAGLIAHIFETGEPMDIWVFALKILFTAVTLTAGFKGGEIVPSFCVGAAFGSCMASIIGLPVPLAAACGMLGVFCGVTNCPVTSLLIGFEMFGFEGMPYYAVTVAASYMLSGYGGLYNTQRMVDSKITLSGVQHQITEE